MEILRQNFLIKILGELSPKEEGILKFRFGIEDGIVHTLEEAGKKYSVTRERIRQIEAKALEKIRQEFDIEMEKIGFIWRFDPYRCLCGTYRGKKHLGIVCNRCGIEVVASYLIVEMAKKVMDLPWEVRKGDELLNSSQHI